MTSLEKALTLISDEKVAEAFLKDICTPQELKALKERWKIAQLLHFKNLSYREIHEQTGASLTTVGRVARFLREEKNQGYLKLLQETLSS
ncbi:MAG: transcriptional regulator [Alphaproteobacteria bacterium]|nr:MAG: transcriptional regulator [Alphaproteobacteria bacterium]